MKNLSVRRQFNITLGLKFIYFKIFFRSLVSIMVLTSVLHSKIWKNILVRISNRILFLKLLYLLEQDLHPIDNLVIVRLIRVDNLMG